MNKNKGFTLIELLMVIVVIAIILAIAIPEISSLVKKSRINAFESNANMVLKAVKYQKLKDQSFDPLLITKGNMNEKIGLDSSNYNLVRFESQDSDLMLILIGAKEWQGLVACGTSRNIKVTQNLEDCITDDMDPIIELTGGAETVAFLGESYVDAGFNAFDVKGVDLSNKVQITGEVDTDVEGVYTLTYTVEDSNNNKVTATRRVHVIVKTNEYSYTGDYQVFTSPINGKYKVELWGAGGGKGRQNGSLIHNGGAGAYTNGIINLKQDETLYVYVGGAGFNSPSKKIGGDGGFNGGAKGGNDNDDDEGSGGGGGATDVRLVDGLWNDTESLRSRIMVAGGGAGSTYGSVGGAGGALSSDAICFSAGATQTTGYALGIGQPGTNHGYTPSSGAGGGYYGGYSKHNGSSSGSQSATGGSSFISGYTGCDSIDEMGIHTGQPLHYSEKSFQNSTMIDGKSSMPTIDGSSSMIGNLGDGYARITFSELGVDPTITLIGEKVINISRGDIYKDPGATAFDPDDGDITDKIVVTSDVNTNMLGTYSVVYSVADSDGNVTTTTRSVIVNLPHANSILEVISNNELRDGNYDIKINGEMYNIELINVDGNTIYKEEESPIIYLGNDIPDERILVVKYNGDLTIESGVLLTPTTRKKGMFIYVKGTLTNNGTISMTARGAVAEGQNVYLWKNRDETYEYVPAVGGAGAVAIKGQVDGIAGSVGLERGTGGGGSGASMRSATKGGNGSAGTSYSGGSGGGGASSAADSPVTGKSASPNGGAGGDAVGRRTSGTMYVASGGAGNPGGKDARPTAGANRTVTGNAVSSADDGTGGLLIIYSNNIYNNAVIESRGSSSYFPVGYNTGVAVSGGSSGGGSVNIFYISNYENNGTITASGGESGPCAKKGGNGGDGSVTIGYILENNFVSLD